MQPTKDQRQQHFVRRHSQAPIISINPTLHFPSKKIQNYLYNYGDLLGQGNFSKVYRGVNQLTNQPVAIKIVELSSITSPKLEELLNSEIEILKAIKHQNVVQCFQVLTSDRNCYIVTELCEGGDLSKPLKNKGSFLEREIYRIALDIFHGLYYLSDRKIVHRDLKVSNIFIRNGHAKIADFGFAKIANSTFLDDSIGSPVYMSPEGLIHNIYGPKTDIWAFGIILFELTHGHTPAANCRTQDELKRAISRQITFNDMKSNLSVELRDLIIRCLDTQQRTRITIHDIGRSLWIKNVSGELGIRDMAQEEQKCIIGNFSISTQKRSYQNQFPLTHIQSSNPNLVRRYSCQPENSKIYPHLIIGMDHYTPNSHAVFPLTPVPISNIHQQARICKPSQNITNQVSKESGIDINCQSIKQIKHNLKNIYGWGLKPVTNGLRVRNNSFSENTQLKSYINAEVMQYSMNKHCTDPIQLNASVFADSPCIDPENNISSYCEIINTNENNQTGNHGTSQQTALNDKSEAHDQNLIRRNLSIFQRIDCQRHETSELQEPDDCQTGDKEALFLNSTYTGKSQFNNLKKENRHQIRTKNFAEMPIIGKTSHDQVKQQTNCALRSRMSSIKQDVNEFISPNETDNNNTLQHGDLEDTFSESNQNIINKSTTKTDEHSEEVQKYGLLFRAGVILPGSIDFRECIGILHYCRLLFKYTLLFKQMQDRHSIINQTTNIHHTKVYAHFLLNLLFELSDKINSRQIHSLKFKSTKERKMKTVIDDYIVKYTDQLGINNEIIERSTPEEKLNLLKLVSQFMQSDCVKLQQNIMAYQQFISTTKHTKQNTSDKFQALLLLAEYSMVLNYSTIKLTSCQMNRQQYTSLSVTSNSSKITLKHNPSFNHFQKDTKIEMILSVTQALPNSIQTYLKLKKQFSDGMKQNQFDRKNGLRIVSKRPQINKLNDPTNPNFPTISNIEIQNRTLTRECLNINIKNHQNNSPLNFKPKQNSISSCIKFTETKASKTNQNSVCTSSFEDNINKYSSIRRFR